MEVTLPTAQTSKIPTTMFKAFTQQKKPDSQTCPHCDQSPLQQQCASCKMYMQVIQNLEAQLKEKEMKISGMEVKFQEQTSMINDFEILVTQFEQATQAGCRKCKELASQPVKKFSSSLVQTDKCVTCEMCISLASKQTKKFAENTCQTDKAEVREQVCQTEKYMMCSTCREKASKPVKLYVQQKTQTKAVKMVSAKAYPKGTQTEKPLADRMCNNELCKKNFEQLIVELNDMRARYAPSKMALVSTASTFASTEDNKKEKDQPMHVMHKMQSEAGVHQHRHLTVQHSDLKVQLTHQQSLSEIKATPSVQPVVANKVSNTGAKDQKGQVETTRQPAKEPARKPQIEYSARKTNVDSSATMVNLSMTAASEIMQNTRRIDDSGEFFSQFGEQYSKDYIKENTTIKTERNERQVGNTKYIEITEWHTTFLHEDKQTKENEGRLSKARSQGRPVQVSIQSLDNKIPPHKCPGPDRCKGCTLCALVASKCTCHTCGKQVQCTGACGLGRCTRQLCDRQACRRNARVLFRVKKQQGKETGIISKDNSHLALKLDSADDPSMISVPFRRITAAECGKLCSKNLDEDWFVSDSITLIKYLIGQFKAGQNWVELGGKKKEEFEGILLDDNPDLLNILYTMGGKDEKNGGQLSTKSAMSLGNTDMTDRHQIRSPRDDGTPKSDISDYFNSKFKPFKLRNEKPITASLSRNDSKCDAKQPSVIMSKDTRMTDVEVIPTQGIAPPSNTKMALLQANRFASPQEGHKGQTGLGELQVARVHGNSIDPKRHPYSLMRTSKSPTDSNNGEKHTAKKQPAQKPKPVQKPPQKDTFSNAADLIVKQKPILAKSRDRYSQNMDESMIERQAYVVEQPVKPVVEKKRPIEKKEMHTQVNSSLAKFKQSMQTQTMAPEISITEHFNDQQPRKPLLAKTEAPKPLLAIFDGTPKPAKSSHDVRQEKEDAMKWIKEQEKAHDVAKSKREAEEAMRKIVAGDKPSSVQDVPIEELNNLEALKDNLQVQKIAEKRDKDGLKDAKTNAQDRFKPFDELRTANLRNAHLELTKKQAELPMLQQTITKQQLANNAASLRMAARMPDVMDSTELKVLTNLQALDSQLQQARQQQIDSRARTQKLKDNFMKIKQNYLTEVDGLRKKLEMEKLKTDQMLDQQTEIDKQVINANKDNMNLKEDTYELNVRHSLMLAQHNQAQRRIQLLRDKQLMISIELRNRQKEIDMEKVRVDEQLGKVQQDQDLVMMEVTRTELELEYLQSHNAAKKELGLQEELEKLELELQLAEVARKRAQDQLKKNEQNHKALMAVTPEELMNCTDPALTQSFHDFSSQLKQKWDLGARLKKRRDELMYDRLKKTGKENLYDQYERIGKDYDRMTDDLKSKIVGVSDNLDGLLKTIEARKAVLASQELQLPADSPNASVMRQRQELSDQIAALDKARQDALENGAGSVVNKVLQAIDEKREQLDQQLEELERLKQLKADQEKEKDMLDRKLKKLNKRGERYDLEIAKMQEELKEQVDELEGMIDRTNYDIEDAHDTIEAQDKLFQFYTDKKNEPAPVGLESPEPLKVVDEPITLLETQLDKEPVPLPHIDNVMQPSPKAQKMAVEPESFEQTDLDREPRPMPSFSAVMEPSPKTQKKAQEPESLDQIDLDHEPKPMTRIVALLEPTPKAMKRAIEPEPLDETAHDREPRQLPQMHVAFEPRPQPLVMSDEPSWLKENQQDEEPLQTPLIKEDPGQIEENDPDELDQTKDLDSMYFLNQQSEPEPSQHDQNMDPMYLLDDQQHEKSPKDDLEDLKALELLVDQIIANKPARKKITDEVESLMQENLKKAKCDVPIKKLGNGFFMFGTKKIYAKVRNGMLVIRVGGGYMVINEFMTTHSEKEMRKVQTADSKEESKNESHTDKLEELKSSRDENVITVVHNEKLGGTKRQKKYTQAQMERMKSNPRAIRDFRSPQRM